MKINLDYIALESLIDGDKNKELFKTQNFLIHGKKRRIYKVAQLSSNNSTIFQSLFVFSVINLLFLLYQL